MSNPPKCTCLIRVREKRSRHSHLKKLKKKMEKLECLPSCWKYDYGTNWKQHFLKTEKGTIKANWLSVMHILCNDPNLKGKIKAENNYLIATAELPWRKIEPKGNLFSDTDVANLAHYCETNYGFSRGVREGLKTLLIADRDRKFSKILR